MTPLTLLIPSLYDEKEASALICRSFEKDSGNWNECYSDNEAFKSCYLPLSVMAAA